ncbi:hypothetical protein ADUPG1_002003, partial [Aduncisulcus paluster]
QDSSFRTNVYLCNPLNGKIIASPCLLDTGTSISTVSYALTKQLGSEINYDEVSTFELADGSTSTSGGSAELRVEVAGLDGKRVTFEEKFIVIRMKKQTTHSILLSGDCIRKYDLVPWSKLALKDDESSL